MLVGIVVVYCGFGDIENGTALLLYVQKTQAKCRMKLIIQSLHVAFGLLIVIISSKYNKS